MTTALYVQTRKEVRALLPWAVGVAATTIAMSAFLNAGGTHSLPGWVLLVHAAGVLTVAALSLGQEITHGTLPSLLVQPVDRRRVLWTKIAVLSGTTLALGLIAEFAFASWKFSHNVEMARILLIWGPTAAGIGLVPLLTLLTRKPLGGAVFAVTIPGLITVVVQRFFSNDAQALPIAWYGTLVASACGLAVLAWMFPRAEAIGDHHSPVMQLRALSSGDSRAEATSRTAPAPRHWIWFAVKNELRLQYLTLAVFGLFILLGAGIVVMQRMQPPYIGAGVGALVALHGIIIAAVAGSRASAEERHLGLIPSQALIPKSAWKTWTIKVLVAVGVAVLLSVALPWLGKLVRADSIWQVGQAVSFSAGNSQHWFGLEREYFAAVALIAVAAIYVSSLSSNSLWALLACIPTGGAAALFAGLVVSPVQRSVYRSFGYQLLKTITPAMNAGWRHPDWSQFYRREETFRDVHQYFLLSCLLGLTLLLLYLAHRNHRSLERGRDVVIRQVGLIAAFLTLAVGAYFATGRLIWLFI